jgi:hypothetical protein
MSTKLFIKECEHGNNRGFSVIFNPDTKHERFVLGMEFIVTSVNRKTGEITFAQCLTQECNKGEAREY